MKPALDNDLHFIASTLRDADKAVSVLFTMCTAAGLREGAMVADEISGNIRTAIKHCMNMMTGITAADAAAMQAVMRALEDEKIARAALAAPDAKDGSALDRGDEP